MDRLPYDFDSAVDPVLYHYTDQVGAEAIISTRSFRMSEFTAMNDPSEFAFSKGELDNLLEANVPPLDIVPHYALAHAFEDIEAATGLFMGSLTTRRDDLTQWRLYGDNGRGCVIGIDADFLERDAGVRICRVLYDANNVSALLKAMISALQDQWHSDKTDFATLQDVARRIVMDMFTIKHPSYADEREVRISRMLYRVDDGYADPGGNGRNGVFISPNAVYSRKGRYGDVSYIDLPLDLGGCAAVTSLGFGPCVPDKIFHAAKAKFERDNLTVWRSSIPYR